MRKPILFFLSTFLWGSLCPLISHAGTGLYRCQDDAGHSVLTDNPVQLLNCVLLQSHSGSLDHSPARSSVRLHEEPPSPVEPSPTQAEQTVKQSPSSFPTEAITIPLTKIGGSFVVNAVLNQERTTQLIVDTGASMTVLSNEVAIALGILGTTETELMTVNTAGGQVQVNVNYLTSLSIGTATANHVAVAIHDLPDIASPIEGLLGMSFLKHFLVTLDAEHSRLTLRPKQRS